MHGQLLSGSCLKYGERGSIALSPKFDESFVGGKTVGGKFVGQIAGNGGHVVVAETEDVIDSVTGGTVVVGNEIDGVSVEGSSVVRFGGMNDKVDSGAGGVEVKTSTGSEVVVINGGDSVDGTVLDGISFEGANVVRIGCVNDIVGSGDNVESISGSCVVVKIGNKSETVES